MSNFNKASDGKIKVVGFENADGDKSFWYKKHGMESYLMLNEVALGKLIGGNFNDLNEKAREKAKMQFFKERCTLKRRSKLLEDQPNAVERFVRDGFGSFNAPNEAMLKEAARNAFQVTELFEDPAVGTHILAYALAGLRCSAIRAECADFVPVLEIHSAEPLVADLMTEVVGLIVTEQTWEGKNVEVEREAVLDFANNEYKLVSKQLIDFSCATIDVSKHHSIETPAEYRDTLALIMNAKEAQVNSASKYMVNATMILLNCVGKSRGHRCTAKQVGCYDPALLPRLIENRYCIAMALETWRTAVVAETWASSIVQDAKQSIIPRNLRYVQVTMEPEPLREAIAYHVFLSFIDYCVIRSWIDVESAEAYRLVSKQVFDPEPEDKSTRRMNDPDVFIQVIRTWMKENTAQILDFDETYTASHKARGAKREISGIQHLMILESEFCTWYPSYAKKLGVDVTFSKRDNWCRELQKALANADVIKHTSSNPRYRHDYYGNGTKDQTYVIAVPLPLLN